MGKTTSNRRPWWRPWLNHGKPMADKTAKIAKLALPLLAFTVLASACSPPNTGYEFGFGTSVVSGIVELGPDNPRETDAIVVVLKNHDMFIPLNQRDEFSGAAHAEFTRNITHPTAHVVPVSKEGAYAISLPANVVSVDIMFVARNKLTRRAHFKRSAVIGRITYRAILATMPDWRSHFYTYLEPQLQEYIVEPRYRLSQGEQRLLGDWLTHQKQALEAERQSG